MVVEKDVAAASNLYFSGGRLDSDPQEIGETAPPPGHQVSDQTRNPMRSSQTDDTP